MTVLSIVVGTYNRLDYLKICVESVVAQTRVPFHLYITDAGSTDGTIEYLKLIASDRIRPVFVGQKLGQARAYNDVFANIETPYLCWISDDNEIVNSSLDIGVEILEKVPSVGMVALKVKDVQGPFVDAPYIGGMSTLGILNVNQGMLRTSVMKSVGCFGEAFRDYGIDPDLTAKVLLAGHDIVYTRAIAIHHHRLWEMDKSKPEYWALRKKQERGLRLYEEKYRPVMSKALLWLARKAAWRLFRDRIGKRFNPNSQRKILGHNARDWGNLMTGRFINPLAELFFQHRNYHLLQKAPRGGSPERLPPEPVADVPVQADV